MYTYINDPNAMQCPSKYLVSEPPFCSCFLSPLPS